MNPLSGLYGAASALRNTLYDRGTLAAHRLQRPVVSVGNISAGGAGKTPFVIALGELLKARGIQFDVLSRGYGRKTRGVLMVDPAGQSRDFGDEPLLIGRRLGVPVIVGESRYAAGRLAEQTFQSQLHLLDDGFQHRSLFRDFDIVLLTERDFDDTLLPTGRLREPLSSLDRSDAIVLPEGVALGPPSSRRDAACRVSRAALQQKPVWRIKRELVLPSLSAVPLVFCGIARAEQFFSQVRAAGVSPAKEVEFRDHHAYTKADVEHLLALGRKLSAGGFLTTEKDAVNLGPLAGDLKPLAIAKLAVTIDRPADVVDAILARIGERKPRS